MELLDNVCDDCRELCDNLNLKEIEGCDDWYVCDKCKGE